MSRWHSQEEVDALVRERVSTQLPRDIAAYDGAPAAAQEILRGLAAARMMEIDLRPFEDALADKQYLEGQVVPGVAALTDKK
jgi:hypothetical protein